MTFNIKKHLQLELIVTLFFTAVMIFFAYNMHLFTIIFGVCCFIGLFNTLYLFITLIEQRKFNVGILVVIFIISFGLQWVLFSLFAIPLIIFEIISVLTNNIYIGNKTNSINEQLEKDKSLCLLTSKEKELFITYIHRVKKVNYIKYAIIMVDIISLVLIGSGPNGVINFALLSCVLLICGTIYFVLKMMIFILADKDLSLSFYNDCDSLSYYHVSKLLYRKYPNNITVMQSFFISTSLDNNDYNELKKLLKKHKSFYKHSFYIRAVLDVYGNGKDNENFNKYYEKATIQNERVLKKDKDNVRGKNNLKYLYARKLELEGKFVEALEIIDSIECLKLKFEKVNHAYVKGKYLMNINKMEEAKLNFEYVIKEGNNLRYCTKAKEYLDIIKNL